MSTRKKIPSIGSLADGFGLEEESWSIGKVNSKEYNVPATISSSSLVEKKYFMTPTSSLLFILKLIIETSSIGNNKKDKGDIRLPRVNKNAELKFRKDMYGNYIYAYKASKSNYDITVKNADRILNPKSSTNMRKVLNFLLQKANEQNVGECGIDETVEVHFYLDELVQRGIYKKSSAKKGLAGTLSKLSMITVGGSLDLGKSVDALSRYGLIYERHELSESKSCFVRMDGKVLGHLRQYYTVLPSWADRLSGKAYSLLDYIYTRARQELSGIVENKKFSIKFETLSMNLGLPSTEEVTDHSNNITKPLIKAIDDVEEELARVKRDYPDAMSLKLTPMYDHNYRNGRDFLRTGRLIIELDVETTEYFVKQSKQYEKKIQKERKRREALKEKKEES